MSGWSSDNRRGLARNVFKLENKASFRSGVCTEYVGAIADMMSNYPYAGLQACFPVDATRDQLVQVSIKFLREHPGVLHLSAYNNVASAFLVAFPADGEAGILKDKGLSRGVSAARCG